MLLVSIAGAILWGEQPVVKRNAGQDNQQVSIAGAILWGSNRIAWQANTLLVSIAGAILWGEQPGGQCHAMPLARQKCFNRRGDSLGGATSVWYFSR